MDEDTRKRWRGKSWPGNSKLITNVACSPIRVDNPSPCCRGAGRDASSARDGKMSSPESMPPDKFESGTMLVVSELDPIIDTSSASTVNEPGAPILGGARTATTEVSPNAG